VRSPGQRTVAAEARSVCQELGDYDDTHAGAWIAVMQPFGSAIRLRELKGIIYSILQILEVRRGIRLPKMTRNTKRNMGCLIKYINSHYEHIVPVFREISLYDINKQPIRFIQNASPGQGQPEYIFRNGHSKLKLREKCHLIDLNSILRIGRSFNISWRFDAHD
jgi:hypothetical protein